jgi:sodium-dependent dicarboxylate transporter 2/3/5
LAGVPLPLLVLAIVTLTTLLSEVASNTATATLLMPLLSATANALGLSPLVLMVPATLAASCGFMLPVATPPNAIAFATGWVSVGAMARTGLFLDVAGIALITLICHWLVPGVLGG